MSDTVLQSDTERVVDRSWRARLHRFGLLFGLGALGVFALVFSTDPAVYQQAADSAGLPIGVVVVLAAAQSLVLVALAVAAGLYAAPRVGLRSHLLEHLAGRRLFGDAARAFARPGLLGGMAVGSLLLALQFVAPTPTSGSSTTPTVNALLASLPLRVFYGGVTEELLLRWGVLAVLGFLLARTVGRRGDHTNGLSPALAWIAIAVSSVLFGIGHLPAATSIYGALTPGVLTFIIGGNTLAGLVFGWLFWRHGLEAAILAHALAHVVAVSVSLLAVYAGVF